MLVAEIENPKLTSLCSRAVRPSHRRRPHQPRTPPPPLAMSVLAKAGALLLAGLYVDAKTDVVSDLGKVGILRSLQSHLDGNSAADRNSVFYIFEQTARVR